MSILNFVLICIVSAGIAAILITDTISKLIEKGKHIMANKRERITGNPLNESINTDVFAAIEIIVTLNPIMLTYYMLKTEGQQRIAGFNTALYAYRIVKRLNTLASENTTLQYESAILKLSELYEENSDEFLSTGKLAESLLAKDGLESWCKDNGFMPRNILATQDMPHKKGLDTIREKIAAFAGNVTPATTTPAQSNKHTLADYPEKFSMFDNDYIQSDKGMLSDNTVKFVNGKKQIADWRKLEGTHIEIANTLYTVTKVSYAGKNLNLKYAGKVETKQTATPATRTKPTTKSPVVTTPATTTPASDIETRMERIEAFMQAIAERL